MILGFSLKSLGSYNDAIASADKALKLNPIYSLRIIVNQ